MFDEKHMAHALAIDFGDPTSFSLRIKARNKVSHNAGDETFERFVEAVLLCVTCSFSMYHPAHIAHSMRAQDVERTALISLDQDVLDCSHRTNEPRSTVRGQPLENRTCLLIRTRI